MADEDVEGAEVKGLAQRIESLSAPDKLRAAAELFEAGRLDLAVKIARKGTSELGALHLLTRRPGKG